MQEAVLEVGSGEGRGRRSGLLPSVVALSFRQWKVGKGMMSLHPNTAGFLYLRNHSLFEVRLPWMTDHERFLLSLTDEALGMTDEAPGMTDEAPGMTDEAPGMTDEAPGMTDEAPGMTDLEGFLPWLTDEAPRMTDPEGLPLFVVDNEGFVPAEGFPPLLAERV
jgi:hypothetical protein